MIETWRVLHHASVGSTNDEARRLATENAASGTVVHADEQVAGRGRRARGWVSPPGNLYISILLRTGLPVTRTPELSFLTAVAVAEATEALLPRNIAIRLKWPNDVLVGDAKIAGILIEQADDAVIIGVGLNILHAPSLDTYKTTAVVLQGGLASVDSARDMLLERLRRLIGVWSADGFGPIRKLWTNRSFSIGAAIQVNMGGEPVQGRFAGLAADGALLLDTAQGRKRIMAGDVVPLNASPASSEAAQVAR
ncbi:MAG TPA: biotin--[acetyl-CoA-carboxylase] ligase [Edaphobacter sp.]|nr:biotin--[acetyl-CoA-carboxylase] ligase [Edaphobacter sp.]